MSKIRSVPYFAEDATNKLIFKRTKKKRLNYELIYAKKTYDYKSNTKDYVIPKELENYDKRIT